MPHSGPTGSPGRGNALGAVYLDGLGLVRRAGPIGEHARELVLEDGDDVELGGEDLDDAGEELVGLGPIAVGRREEADELGVGGEVADEALELADAQALLGEVAVDGGAEGEAVVAPEVGLDSPPVLV